MLDRDKKINEEKTDTQSKKKKIYDYASTVITVVTFLVVILLLIVSFLNYRDVTQRDVTWREILLILANLIAILVSFFKIAKNAETDSEIKLEKSKRSTWSKCKS